MVTLPLTLRGRVNPRFTIGPSLCLRLFRLSSQSAPVALLPIVAGLVKGSPLRAASYLLWGDAISNALRLHNGIIPLIQESMEGWHVKGEIN